jgi:deoxyribonuclease V
VWAGGVLEAASVTLGKFPEIQAALALAVDSTQWPEGRAVFDQIRQRGLDKDKPLTAAEDLCFRLAELVAKLAHNAAGPPPPFDYHAGWQVGPIAYRLAGELKDPALRQRLAAALDGWPEAE